MRQLYVGNLKLRARKQSARLFLHISIANLPTAYEFTKYEIETAANQIHAQLTQEDWACLVDEIEEVFSREHVTWQASHSGEIRRLGAASGQ